MIYSNQMIKDIKLKKEKKKKIVKTIFFPFLIILILFASSIFFQKYIQQKNNIDFFGVKPFIVITGSMEPSYNIGDLIFVKAKTNENININDVITYSLGNGKETVTHRVVDIMNKDGEILYKTKGDNNNSADFELVKSNQIQGTIIFKISKIGIIISKLVTGAGIMIILIILAIMYIHSSREDEKILLREYTRRMYNIPKYENQ